jgi:DNA mismatch repair ATPase MutS
MGGRLLKRWLALPPLKDSNKMTVMRLSLFTRKPGSVAKNAKQIKQISDLERLISKLHLEKCRHAKWFI